MKKIFWVSLASPYNGKTDYFFASLAAIYEVLPVDVVGCKLSNLWGIVEPGKPYQNKKCKITEDSVFVKPTQRKGGFK